MIDTRTFPSAARSVKHARRFAVQRIANPATADAVSLMVSELATNCVRHANSDFTITITIDATGLRVEVSDQGDGEPQLRHPGPTEPTGRGLHIVASLADDWGTRTNHNGGSTVWFNLASNSTFSTNTEREETAPQGDRDRTNGSPRQPEATGAARSNPHPSARREAERACQSNEPRMGRRTRVHQQRRRTASEPSMNRS